MAHEVENMMYVGATPWHGLGVKLESAPSIAEAIKAGGLDWSVALSQLQTADGRTVDRFAVVRSTDSAILGTVGRTYEPLQNELAFQFFEPFIQAKAATIETAGSLKGGARVFMLAKIDRPDSVIVPQSDDRVAKYLLLANGHDGSLAVSVSLTPIRVVCQNTLSAVVDNKANSTIRIRHTSGAASALTEVQRTIDQADNDFERAADVFRSLAKVKVKSGAQLKRYVDAVFRPRRVQTELGVVETAQEETQADRLMEQIEALFAKGRGNDIKGVKGTAWGAYNAVTEYLSHERGKSQDNRMDSLWFRNAGIGSRALSAARQEFLVAA